MSKKISKIVYFLTLILAIISCQPNVLAEEKARCTSSDGSFIECPAFTSKKNSEEE